MGAKFAWLLFVIAAGCFLVASLDLVIAGFDPGPALAWFYGGFAAWLLGLAAASLPARGT